MIKKSLAVLIKKGEIDKEALELLNHDESWLKSQLKKQKFEGDIKNIYFAEWMETKDDQGNHIRGDFYIIQNNKSKSN